MSAFEHVTALLSFVYALALTHLLARIGELIVIRERVRFSGLLALGMINAIITVFSNWLSLWDMRSVTSWDLGSIAVQFTFAILLYLVCVLVGPKAPDDGTIDLEDFFWRQRRYFYGAVLSCEIVALIANLDFLKSNNVALFVKENLATLPMIIPTIVALFSRNRVVQWICGLIFFASMVIFTILFSSKLG